MPNRDSYRFNQFFGYKVVKKDGGRKLEPDEVSMKIVQRIFNMYVDGVNTLKIAKELNEKTRNIKCL